MVGQMLGTAAAGCLLGVLSLWFGRSLGLSHHYLRLSAVIFCLMGALAAGDVLIDESGDWWARHAMLAATISGLLFLGLTVLFIDRILEGGRVRRLKSMLAGPMERLLKDACADLSRARDSIDLVPLPQSMVGRTELWSGMPEFKRSLHELRAAAAGIERASADLRQAFLQAGEDFYGLYMVCYLLSRSCGSAEYACREIASQLTFSDDLVLSEPEESYRDRKNYIGWLWSQVGSAFNRLAAVLEEFHEMVDDGSIVEVGKSEFRFVVPEQLEQFETHDVEQFRAWAP